jgi:hypothetical protein
MRFGTYSAAVVLATAASLPLGASSVAAQGVGSPRRDAQAATSAAPAHVVRPLERLAAEHILVLPVQYLVFGDSLGWGPAMASPRAYLSTLDDEIAFALRERGLDGRWTLAPSIVESAQRNAGFSADPHAIEARPLRPGAKLDEWQLPEPLASQLRSLIALTDARYVLFPVELRTTSAGASGRAVLHVVVVDARRSQVQWAGDVVSAPHATMSPAIAAELGSRLADLVAAPAE